MPHQVKEWNNHFEGAKSRTYSNKSSCQMPTKHGLGYKRIVKRKNGPALFGAWCALIQVLSRHPKPRDGYCTDTGRIDGKPYTDADLEMMTDIPAAVFKELFQVAASQDVDWLRIPQGYHADTTSADGAIYSDSNSDSDSNSNSTPPEGVGCYGEFDEFWKAYPRKAAKKAALKAWRNAKDKPPLADVLAAIATQRRTPGWTKDGGQFIPYPATWINRGCWEDKSVEAAQPMRNHI
jgi:hypothetical protein